VRTTSSNVCASASGSDRNLSRSFPGREADQVRSHRDGLRHLLVGHLAERLSPHGQVGVAQPGPLRGEHLREPVRPAEVAGLVGARIVQSLGEAVAERDKGANLHGHVAASLPGQRSEYAEIC